MYNELTYEVWIPTFFVAAGLALLPEASRAELKPSANLDLARQLNQAFVQVAEEVEPSVVVITVIEKPYSSLHTEGDESDGQDADPLQRVAAGVAQAFPARVEGTTSRRPKNARPDKVRASSSGKMDNPDEIPARRRGRGIEAAVACAGWAISVQSHRARRGRAIRRRRHQN